MFGIKSRLRQRTPREPLWVISTGCTSALISQELQYKRDLQSTFLVPITTGFSFFLCLSIVKWIGWFNFNIRLESNLETPFSPSNSKMKLSSKNTSQPALACLVWYLLFKKLTATEMYSSSRGLTKSTNALPLAILHDKYLLLGSSPLAALLKAPLYLVPDFDWPRLSEPEMSMPGPALLFEVTVIPFLTEGMVLIMSPRMPSLLSFSMIWFLSSLPKLGSFATADLMVSKNLCFSRWSLTSVLTYSICAPEILFELFYIEDCIFEFKLF